MLFRSPISPTTCWRRSAAWWWSVGCPPLAAAPRLNASGNVTVLGAVAGPGVGAPGDAGNALYALPQGWGVAEWRAKQETAPAEVEAAARFQRKAGPHGAAQGHRQLADAARHHHAGLEQRVRLEAEFDHERTEMFFASAVVLVEGQTEAIALPLISICY